MLGVYSLVIVSTCALYPENFRFNSWHQELKSLEWKVLGNSSAQEFGELLSVSKGYAGKDRPAFRFLDFCKPMTSSIIDGGGCWVLSVGAATKPVLMWQRFPTCLATVFFVSFFLSFPGRHFRRKNCTPSPQSVLWSRTQQPEDRHSFQGVLEARSSSSSSSNHSENFSRLGSSPLEVPKARWDTLCRTFLGGGGCKGGEVIPSQRSQAPLFLGLISTCQTMGINIFWSSHCANWAYIFFLFFLHGSYGSIPFLLTFFCPYNNSVR